MSLVLVVLGADVTINLNPAPTAAVNISLLAPPSVTLKGGVQVRSLLQFAGQLSSARVQIVAAGSASVTIRLLSHSQGSPTGQSSMVGSSRSFVLSPRSSDFDDEQRAA